MTFHRTGILIAIGFSILIVGQPSLAQDCDAQFETILWKDRGSDPDLPEMSVTPVEDAKINPAVLADTTTKPYSMAGKFVSSVDGTHSYCVAQFVDKNILLTAAHCVRNKTGAWLSRFEFSPSSSSVKMISEAKCLVTSSNFVTGPSPFHWPADYAFVVLTEEHANEFFTIETAPSKSDEVVDIIGYPRNIDDGKNMYSVAGLFLESRQLDVMIARGEGTGVVIHGEPRFGVGISGGGWIASPKPGLDAFRILGLNGTGPGKVAAMGARLGFCAQAALQFARNSCSTSK